MTDDLHTAYKTACGKARELYRPSEKSPDWEEACKLAQKLWKDLHAAGLSYAITNKEKHTDGSLPQSKGRKGNASPRSSRSARTKGA